MTTSRTVDWSAFYTRLHAFVAARVRVASDVDDLVQLVLERALANATEGEIEHAGGWLFAIARNAIADHYRAQARSLVAAAAALETVDESAGFSEEERAMVIACMQPLLQTLPADSAQLLRWADMDGRSMQSIADTLGISLTAAKSRVQRARKEFVTTTRECCAISIDARGRVTGLTPRKSAKADECVSCVSDPELRSKIRHEC